MTIILSKSKIQRENVYEGRRSVDMRVTAYLSAANPQQSGQDTQSFSAEVREMKYRFTDHRAIPYHQVPRIYEMLQDVIRNLVVEDTLSFFVPENYPHPLRFLVSSIDTLNV